MRSAAMRRPVLLAAAWTASAAAAIGLGFLAVSLVGASASPSTQSAGSTTTSATPSPQPVGSSVPEPTVPATGEHATVGGTVYADCTSGQPVLAGVPAAGWTVDDSPKPGEVEFRNGTQKLEVTAYCAAGSPYFVGDDSNTGGAGIPSSSSASSAASPSEDDSSGRDGGGHGSDDGPGDDSSGRDGGGHGSDD
jgi:hypothetical protein